MSETKVGSRPTSWHLCTLLSLGYVTYLWLIYFLRSEPHLTQDSYGYWDIGGDILRLHPPNLEAVAQQDGHPVNPWPLAVPVISGLIQGIGVLDPYKGLTILWVLASGLSMFLAARFIGLEKPLWIMAFISSQGIAVLGHAWSEPWMLATFFGLRLAGHSIVAAAVVVWLSQTRYLAFTLLAGFDLLKRRHSVWLAIGFLFTATYLLINFFYTGYPTGGERPGVGLGVEARLWHQVYALGQQSLIWRQGANNLISVLQIMSLSAIMVNTAWDDVKRNALWKSGLSYTVATVLAYNLVAFAEPLDNRLLGPGMLLIFISIFANSNLQKRTQWAVVVSTALAQLPFRLL